MLKTSDCIKCNKALIKETFCYECDTLQIDINSVNWTLKTCNKCCSIQPADLDPENPFCLDCKMFIKNQNNEVKKIKKESKLSPQKAKLNFRWLNEWFRYSYNNKNLYFFWTAPEFNRKIPPKIKKYSLRDENFDYVAAVNGDNLTLVIKNYPENKKAKFFLSVEIEKLGWLQERNVTKTLTVIVKT